MVRRWMSQCAAFPSQPIEDSNLSRLTLTVIILNWNGRPFLQACLEALEAQTYRPERIVFVDNGSADDSVAFVRGHFPAVEVRENGGNLGFAAGNNTVLRELGTDAAVLLNPDVVLEPDYLAVIAATLASDPRIGIVGGKLWYPDRETIQHGGGFITRPQAMPGHYGIGERDAGQNDTSRDVDYLIGAATAVRRAMLATIGLLDEGYFLYYEDTDLCRRALEAGYRVVYEPRAAGVHVESAVAAKGSFAYFQRFHTGRWRYLLKHFPPAVILEETVPAEAGWLTRIAADERRAASLAYLATLHALPDIWRIRAERDPLPEEMQAAIERQLIALRDLALQELTGASLLPRLTAVAQLEELPFTSTVPVLGRLIVWFRTAWNNIASRWYVRHLLLQQNEFNRLVVAQVETYETELKEQLELLEEQVVSQEELRRRVQELSAALTTLRQSMKDREEPLEAQPGSPSTE